MYIDIEKHYMLKDLLDLRDRPEIITPEEGFIIGNLFYELYAPYKNYKPMKVVPKNEQEALRLRIQELDFAINDLVIYLDLYPNNQDCINIYKEYLRELNKCCETYSEKYGPLNIEKDLKDGYNWIKGPWPWEGKNV